MQQLDPKAVWLFFLSSVIAWIATIFLVGFWMIPIFLDQAFREASLGLNWVRWSWLILIVAIMLSYLWARLSYRFYRYELSDLGFRKESGVIIKSYVTIPYSRIQNVDIYRGILSRILGLSDLQIQTAGSSATVGRYGARGMGAEGRLPGISHEMAEQLRDELIRRANTSRNQGL